MMGAGIAPLAAPLRSKLFERRGNDYFQVACAAMQGSRATMEDGHVLQMNMSNNNEVAIFGVFDGHAGEYPLFCFSGFVSPHLGVVVDCVKT